MNRQINYVINAVLVLTVIGISFWLLQKLSDTKTKKPEASVVVVTTNTVLSESALKGKVIFMSKCASCHAIFKNMTGPGIEGFLERGPWVDRKNLYEWIRNPSAFMKKNEYVRELKKAYGSMMTAFPDLTDEEIDAICDYVNQTDRIDYGKPVAER